MQDFFALTPDAILAEVERALSSDGLPVRATGRCLVHASMENRVYELELEEPLPGVGARVVAKFYRPGRWSLAALRDEHDFLAELDEAELPVVPALPLPGNRRTDAPTLGMTETGIYFAVFPKVAGRALQELTDEQLVQVGRLLGRLHNVGAARPARHRPRLLPTEYATPALAATLDSQHVDIQVRSRYERAARGLIERATPLFAGVSLSRVHGDCHGGNLLWQTSGPFFLDLDDLMLAPPVQDLWMVVRGRSGDEDADGKRELLLSGYEQLRAFDRQTLRLIEPLRGLRMIHYAGWIARRYEDPIFQRTFPDFTSYAYWADEAAALEEQLRLIVEPVAYLN